MFEISSGKSSEGAISTRHVHLGLNEEFEQRIKLIGLFAELAQGFKWTRFPPAGSFQEWKLPTASHGKQLTALLRGSSPHEVYLKSSYGFEFNPYFAGPISLSKASSVKGLIEKAYELSDWAITPALNSTPMGDFSIQLEMETDSTRAFSDLISIRVLIDVGNPFEFFVSTVAGSKREPNFYGPFKVT
jgi:hypothetical protein